MANMCTEVADPESLAELVRQSLTDSVPLVDYGRVHEGVGHPPPSVHTRFCQTIAAGGDGIIEHYTRDLTVRVSAGATVRQVNEALRPTHQFLPLDADEDLSIGEVLMHDVYGPLRAGYGSGRDLLLGLRYIDGLGRDIHVGGRTVKNVAGYDVGRLMVGSLGELGIVYEVTLRTYAVPEEVRVVTVALTDPDTLSRNITNLLLTDASPTGLSLHGDASGWRAIFRYCNTHGGCVVQQADLERRLTELAGDTARVESVQTLTPEADETARTAERAWRRQADLLVKVVTPPALTGSVAALLREGGWRIDALPVHGCIFVGGEGNAADALRLDRTINETIDTHGPLGGRGFRVWYNRLADADLIAPFAPPQSDYALLCRIKSAMDPHNIFNPGRYLRG